MALGAARREVIGMVVREGMILAVVGLLFGCAASALLGRFVSTLLFGVSTTDASVFGAVALILALAAFFACYVPALRATRIDPLKALRIE